MLVAGGAHGRIQRAHAVTISPTMAVDNGMVRPSARTYHRGEWCDERNGLVVFGGAFEKDMCDPQVYCLKPSVHGWKWEVFETSGDESMPVPGKPTPKYVHAPWANKGGAADPGIRIGHCFCRTKNFMVLTGGIRDMGALQNAVYILDVISGEWSKPVVRLTPPDPFAINASSRSLEGTTPEGLPSERTGHSATGFDHGVVLFGGFDGKYLGDVHYLYFWSGVGLILQEREKRDEDNKFRKQLSCFVIAEILPGSSASDNVIIKVGDHVMAVGDMEVHDGSELSELKTKMWGPLGSLLVMRFMRYRGRAQPPEDLGDQTFTRGKQLFHKDGVWTWIRPGISITELTDINFYHQSGVSGTVSCQPSPRFYHSSGRIDNNVLIFGGCDEADHRNDLYLLETYAEGDFNREWKWRVPTTSGQPPSPRGYAALGVVGRKAVITGGLHGRELLGDIFILDCDTWTWTKLALHNMIPIAQHLVAPYSTYPTQAEYDQLTNSELETMSMEQLWDLVQSMGNSAKQHETKNKDEVVTLMRLLLLRPGLLLFAGLQHPLEEGEKSGRRNDTWVLELPYSAHQHAASVTASPLRSRSPLRGSPLRGSPLRGSPGGSPLGVGPPHRSQNQDGMQTDVLAVGSNLQGYLGLGLEYQPSHPQDSGLGPARFAHDTHPTTCIRLGSLSADVFEYYPSAGHAQLNLLKCVKNMACGAAHVVAVSFSGALFAWGKNENGQLGLGDNRQRQSPQEVYTFPARSHEIQNIVCGHHHTMASNSLDEVFSWGMNGHGQLGLGHSSDRNSPQRVEPLCFRKVLGMAGGTYHSLVYVKNGGLFSFGCNDHGQLGCGTQIGSRLPINVSLLKETEIVSVSAGVMHSAAVSSSGACYTWGGGIRGQLGHGRFEDSWLAKEVELSGLQDKETLHVVCGDFFTGLVVREPSLDLLEAWLFGSNKHGELGFGAGGQDCAVPVFVQHLTGKGLTGIHLGSSHCLATCRDGMIYGWGCNRSGQLGLGHTRDMWAPQQILIEEGGRTDATNYPWLASPSDETLSRAMRAANPHVMTKIIAGKDASFFICRIEKNNVVPETYMKDKFRKAEKKHGSR